MRSYEISMQEISKSQIAKTAILIFAHSYELISRNDDLSENVNSRCIPQQDYQLHFGIGFNIDWSGVTSVRCVKLIDIEKYEPKGAV